MFNQITLSVILSNFDFNSNSPTEISISIGFLIPGIPCLPGCGSSNNPFIAENNQNRLK